MRFGISATSSIFPKNFRTRFRPINVCAIMSSRSIDPSSPSRLRLAPSSRIRGFEIPGRLGRLSRGPPSIATVGTGVVPPYPAVIRLSAEPSHHACRTLTAEGGHRDARATTLSLFMTRVHQAYAGLTSNGPAVHNCNLSGLPRRAHGTRASPVCKHCLLKLNLRTSLFQLRLDFRGFVLVDRLFDRFGSPFDQVLGFLEPKARDRAHFLDHLDLLLAGGRKHDGELGLFLGSG